MLMTRDAQIAPGRLHVAAGGAADGDAAAAAADPVHAFLRGAWAEAAAPGAVRWHTGLRADASILAAVPLVAQRLGPLAVRQVAGCYWPFRSIALAADAKPEELAALLADPALKRALGPAWRLGPVFDSDPAGSRLREAAGPAGWTVLTRRLGTCFEIDVAALLAEGPWPRGSSMKKNRWREKKLGELGRVEVVCFTGADWTSAHRDAIAQIEHNCWLAELRDKAGLQFADPAQRGRWERVAGDPALAAMLFGSILSVGGVPAAFTFGLEVGRTRYYIANNFDQRFYQHSAGRTLLLKDFERAARIGIRRISWGSGDAGYKSNMGARPGPAIVDLLFVRSRLMALPLKRFWERPGTR